MTEANGSASPAANRTERKHRRRAARAQVQAPPSAGLRHASALFALAAAGVLLTAYLTATAWLGTGPALCAAGSGCDVVRASRWSTLLGLPLALWGAGLYAVLAALLWRGRRRSSVWRWAWLVACLGAAISIYYTVVAGVELEAFCAWCLLSLALLLALAAGLGFSRPADDGELRWGIQAPAAALVAAAVVGLLHLHHQGVFDPAAGPEKPRLRALAEHLSATGARFYGAFWCPHCNDQKALFEASAARLPYIECSPNGRRGPRPAACATAGIEAYPTWVIDGRRFERVLTPQALARYSGFVWTERATTTGTGLGDP